MENNNLNLVDDASENKNEGYVFLGTATERFIFIVVLGILSCAPIMFGKGIPSHADWHIHMVRASIFKTAFWEGNFLPRWVDFPASGYGLPVFNFYASLIYYLYAFVDLFFRDPIISIKLSFILPMILCYIFGYIYLRNLGSSISATITMAFLVFSPAIHIFIYNTNWPGSTLAIAFLFMALYGIDSFKDKFDLKNILIVALSYAGVVLSHLATGFMFTLLCVPYFLFNLAIHRSRAFVKNFIFSFILGGGLCAYYIIPATLETKLVNAVEVHVRGVLWDFSKNFLFTYLDRSAQEGYAWAIFDHRYYEVSNALFISTVGIFIVILLANIQHISEITSKGLKVYSKILMFLISFIMMTPISMFVWLLLKPLKTIQFPWRFTSFVLVFGLAVIVYALDLIRVLSSKYQSSIGYKYIFAIVFILFGALSYVDFINMYKWKWAPEESLLRAARCVLWPHEEYRPKVDGNPDILKYGFDQDFAPAVFSTNPNINIEFKKWDSSEKVFEVFSEIQHQAQLRIIYYLGWNIFIDGKPTDVRVNKSSGAIVINIPPGKHEVRAVFRDTGVRKIADYISLISLVLFVVLCFKLFRKNDEELKTGE